MPLNDWHQGAAWTRRRWSLLKDRLQHVNRPLSAWLTEHYIQDLKRLNIESISVGKDSKHIYVWTNHAELIALDAPEHFQYGWVIKRILVTDRGLVASVGKYARDRTVPEIGEFIAGIIKTFPAAFATLRRDLERWQEQLARHSEHQRAASLSWQDLHEKYGLEKLT